VKVRRSVLSLPLVRVQDKIRKLSKKKWIVPMDRNYTPTLHQNIVEERIVQLCCFELMSIKDRMIGICAWWYS